MIKNKAKYAVIKIGNSQQIVSEGDEILVDKQQSDKPEVQVLLYVDSGKVNLGKPLLKKPNIRLKVINSEEKGQKVDVFKYKAKSRYRKHIGFRPKYTRLKVEKFD